jgi:phasin
MAKDPLQNFEIPSDMRAFAEKSVEQAKAAFDGFLSAAFQTMSAMEGQAAAMRKGSDDIRQKAMAMAEQNLNASFEFARQLARAKDLQELVKLQTDYVNSQAQTLSAQAKELGQATTDAAKDAAKPGR